MRDSADFLLRPSFLSFAICGLRSSVQRSVQRFVVLVTSNSHFALACVSFHISPSFGVELDPIVTTSGHMTRGTLPGLETKTNASDPSSGKAELLIDGQLDRGTTNGTLPLRNSQVLRSLRSATPQRKRIKALGTQHTRDRLLHTIAASQQLAVICTTNQTKRDLVGAARRGEFMMRGVHFWGGLLDTNTVALPMNADNENGQQLEKKTNDSTRWSGPVLGRKILRQGRARCLLVN